MLMLLTRRVQGGSGGFVETEVHEFENDQDLINHMITYRVNLVSDVDKFLNAPCYNQTQGLAIRGICGLLKLVNQSEVTGDE